MGAVIPEVAGGDWWQGWHALGVGLGSGYWTMVAPTNRPAMGSNSTGSYLPSGGGEDFMSLFDSWGGTWTTTSTLPTLY